MRPTWGSTWPAWGGAEGISVSVQPVCIASPITLLPKMTLMLPAAQQSLWAVVHVFSKPPPFLLTCSIISTFHLQWKQSACFLPQTSPGALPRLLHPSFKFQLQALPTTRPAPPDSDHCLRLHLEEGTPHLKAQPVGALQFWTLFQTASQVYDLLCAAVSSSS